MSEKLLTLPDGAAVFDPNKVLSGDDTQWEWVAVPAWGGGCFVRNLSSAERDQFEIDIAKMQRKKAAAGGLVRATMVQRCACGADKQPLFRVDQIPMLARKNAQAVDAVSSVALRLSGMSETDVDDVGKNFEAAPSGSSG